MIKRRVLIVDDSQVVRAMLSRTISSDPEIEVVAMAGNGREALDKIALASPEVVLLDIEMPEMDGLQALNEIRARWPRLPVIIVSSITTRGAMVTIEALSRGASDYVTKPSQLAPTLEGMSDIREQLVEKIKILAELYDTSPFATRAAVPPRAPRFTPARRGKPRVEVLAIGSSTGGPNALGVVLPALPKDLPVPIVIVQHMPPMFTTQLARTLDGKCKIRVAEAKNGDVLEPGLAYVAPGAFHMRVARNASGDVAVATSEDEPVNSCRPSVDVLLHSAVEVYRGGVLAVILTGMGRDGAAACAAVRAVNGRVLAQDEATSVVWGMPGQVVAAGVADEVIPLPKMAERIMEQVRDGRSRLIGRGSVP